jgi:hypothetical protein
MRFPLITLPLTCFVLFVLAAVGQSPDGNINGLVLDPTNRVIAGAEIIAVNDLTNVQFTTKTNDEGVYVIPNLPPGSYRLQVSKVGFKTIIKPDIVLNVQDALSINFTLPIGALLETVTVQGGGPLVNTVGASVSTVIDQNFVAALPLNGRSFNTLLQLTPGVVLPPAVDSSSGQFSVAGQRTDANNFTVDGVSANFGVPPVTTISEAGTGGAQAFSVLGGTSSLVSVEALQEFRVETSSFAPQFGRSPGGQVILVTRSGTHNFHGGIYEYFRNDVLDANDWFANNTGQPRAPERHNDFGGFLGGPLWRNRTFFFLSYEGARLRVPQTRSIEVPSVYARTLAPPALAPYLAAYPQPNGPSATATAYTAPFTGGYSGMALLDAGSIRVDHKINQRFSIFGRFNDAPSSSAGRSQGLSFLDQFTVNTKTVTAGVDMSLSNRVVNALRANYSTQFSSNIRSFDSFGGAVPLDPALLLGSLPSANVVVAFFTYDLQVLQAGPRGRNRTQQINVVDDLSVNSALHQFRFGGDYRGIFLRVNSSQYNAVFSARSLQDFLATGVANLSISTLAGGRLLAQAVSAYAQDTWKITPRLTLTYGLRWELSPAPSPLGTTALASWTHVNDPAGLRPAPAGRPIWNTTFSNFAPRVGVAYSLDEKGDFVLRAGAGIFYDLGVGSSASAFSSFPNLASQYFSGVPLPVTDLTSYLPAISLQPPYTGTIYGFAPDLKLPRSYQWNAAVEKSFGNVQSVSATFVGQAGRRLLRQDALFQPNQNFTGEFLLTQNSAWSNYDALQLQYRRRLASGLQTTLNYSWSHSLDNASNDVVAGLSGTVISAANDYSSSSFDARHSLSGAITYAVPGQSRYRMLAPLTNGWSIDAVIVARSGFPFNAQIYSESPDPGSYAVIRPDRISEQSFWTRNAQAPGGKILNVNAFSIPNTVRQGTEGRNDIPGFGLTQLDLSLGHKFSIGKRLNLQFRADAFNVFNHPNFINPQALPEFGAFYMQSQSMLNQQLGGLNPLFQEGGPRSLQLSLKLTF